MTETTTATTPTFTLGQGWWDGGCFFQPVRQLRDDGVGMSTGLLVRSSGAEDGLTVIERNKAIAAARTTDDLRTLPYVIDGSSRR